MTVKEEEKLERAELHSSCQERDGEESSKTKKLINFNSPLPSPDTLGLERE
jgi:hypothetical protein